MPRDGSGVYSKPAGTTASPNTTIESAKYNSVVDDLVVDANAARPITAGGTGRATARLVDGTWRWENTADPTKLLAFDLSGLTPGTRTLTAPDASGTIALIGSESFPQGHLYGVALSNNATDATNDIDITAGSARDSTNVGNIVLSAAITKRLDAAWAVGTGNGGLDTGTIANGTYHLYLIKRVDTGVVDVIFSASSSAPTLPTNYTLYRRIGSIVRVGGAIAAFVQEGDDFLFSSPTVDINTNVQGATAILYTLPVPKGIKVKAKISGYATNAALTSTYFSSPYQTDIVANNNGPVVSAGGFSSVLEAAILTNTSGQIRIRADTASTQLRFATSGWTDTRGRI